MPSQGGSHDPESDGPVLRGPPHRTIARLRREQRKQLPGTDHACPAASLAGTSRASFFAAAENLIPLAESIPHIYTSLTSTKRAVVWRHREQPGCSLAFPVQDYDTPPVSRQRSTLQGSVEILSIISRFSEAVGGHPIFRAWAMS